MTLPVHLRTHEDSTQSSSSGNGEHCRRAVEWGVCLKWAGPGLCWSAGEC